MNQRDLSEIKRRLTPDHSRSTVLCGCYISSDGRVISRFSRPVGSLPQEESERYMAIFRRCLSGTMGQNLLTIDFSNEQVMGGEQHALLTALCNTALQEEDVVERLYQRGVAYVQELHAAQAQSVEAEQAACNHLMLLLHDSFDVPYRNQNGEIDREQSEGVFGYILCALCPVKRSKPALSYYAAESEFHNRLSDWVVSAPELGFLFPAYEERGANIYRSLYYTRQAGDLHDAFAKAVLDADPQMTAVEQKETFQTLLQETLADDCKLETIQAVHETINGMLEERKADKTAEPLRLTQREVRQVLEECGVPQERAAAFEAHCAQAFGAQTELPAVNLITPRQFQVDTPCVSIRVDPEHSDLIETRVIDGLRYLLVRVDGNVEVNGLQVRC